MAATGPRIGLELREVPKAGGGVRVLTLLDDPTAVDYAARVAAAVTPTLVASRSHGPFGLATSPVDLAVARAGWRSAVRSAIRRRTAIRSDVRACYPSIAPDAVRMGLASAGARAHDTERLVALLRRIERAGLPGLPVGPSPSAIVAEAVLSLGDRAVEGAGGTIVRWVDDVVITGPDRATAWRAFDVWRTRLLALGLDAHEGKTALLETEDPTWEPSRSWAGARGMMRAP